MKNITLSGSENNSKSALQNPMHLKLKNSWKSELLTWFFPMTFCSWVYAIQSSDPHKFWEHSCQWLNLVGSSVDPVQFVRWHSVASRSVCVHVHVTHCILFSTSSHFNIYNYKIQMRIWKESTTKGMQIQKGGPNSSFLYKTTPGWHSVL